MRKEVSIVAKGAAISLVENAFMIYILHNSNVKACPHNEKNVDKNYF